MNTTKKSTFNLLFIIKKSRLLKNGEAPICLRITVQGQVADVMVKRSISPKLWNQAKECSNGTGFAARELNHYLETVKARIYQYHRQLEVDGKRVTSNALRDCYLGRDDSSRTIIGVYKEHNDRCRALIGIDYTESTVKKFETSLNCLCEYVKYQYHSDDVLLSDIDGQFIRDFDFYLKTVRRLKQNSAVKHHKNLKKVIRIAIANDWIRKDPYYGFTFKHEETNPEYLTKEELETLRAKEFEIPRLEVVRDIFVFCAFTGFAFIDVKTLTPDHITKDNDGELWIRKGRQKNGNMCNVPLLKPAQQLLEKYADHPECVTKGVLLPVMSNQKMNAYLKEIANLCGIKKRLTCHVSRHTCATAVLLANGVTMENVAKILGHSSTKMTQHYARVLDSSIKRDMVNVEKCFSEN